MQPSPTHAHSGRSVEATLAQHSTHTHAWDCPIGGNRKLLRCLVGLQAGVLPAGAPGGRTQAVAWVPRGLPELCLSEMAVTRGCQGCHTTYLPPPLQLRDAEAALKTLLNQSSEIGDERPIVGCAFSPDGAHLATGSWSGALKVCLLWHVAQAGRMFICELPVLEATMGALGASLPWLSQ